jgi:biopolymer transport protein ExbD
LDLPKASTSNVQMREMLVVTIDSTGQTYVDKQIVDRVQLFQAVKTYHDQQPDGLLVLRAAQTAFYNDVVQVLDVLRAVGGDRVALATEPTTQVPGQPTNPTAPGQNPSNLQNPVAPGLQSPALNPAPGLPGAPVNPTDSNPGALQQVPTNPNQGQPLPGGQSAPLPNQVPGQSPAPQGVVPNSGSVSPAIPIPSQAGQ